MIHSTTYEKPLSTFFFLFARRSRIFNDSSFQFVRRLLAMHAGTVLQLNVPIPTIQCVYIYKDHG